MKRKKDRPEVAPSRRSCPGLAPRTIDVIIISNSRQNASPNPDGEGGFSPMPWAFALSLIGAGWLTGQLFRVVDWIERR